MLKPVRDMRRIVVTLLCMAGSVLAQQRAAALRGSVLDPEKLPVGKARVTLTNLGNPSVKFAITTNALGVFEVEKLEPGTYRLQVRATGFEAHEAGPLQLRPAEQAILTPLRLEIDLTHAICVLLVTADPTSAETLKPGK